MNRDYLKEQASNTVNRMVKDIQEQGSGFATDYLKGMSQNYFKPLYMKYGMAKLKEALRTYLDIMEKDQGLTNIEFLVHDEVVDKETYIISVANKIQIEVECYDAEEEDYNPDAISLPGEDPDQEKNHSTEKSTTVLYENCIKEEYAKFVSLHQEQEKIEKTKQRLIKHFAEDVVEWSHFKFNQPTTGRGIQLYQANRNEYLRNLLTDYDLYKTLQRKIKKLDNWGKIDKLEDELSAREGICSYDYEDMNSETSFKL